MASPPPSVKWGASPANAGSGPVAPVPAELETVIVTAALVPLFPAGSCATAVNAWVLLESVVVSSEIEYGEAVSCAPVFVPSTTNCTKDTGLSGSVAVAVSVIAPETVALFAGAVTVTTGVVVSAVTVKLTPLLATPPTVTTTLPVVAPAGTGATMLVALQLVGAVVVPLNLTVLDPCVAPKFAPAIVTEVPINPDVGFKLVMLGAGTVTVKLTPLLATPPTVTTTLPVVAPAGTGTTMLVALQLVGAVAVPLNVTVLVPCVAPKFAPAIVTDVPTNPDVGFKLVMLGANVALFTLTGTPVLVAVFLEVSVATAVKMWFPSDKVVVFSA